MEISNVTTNPVSGREKRIAKKEEKLINKQEKKAKNNVDAKVLVDMLAGNAESKTAKDIKYEVKAELKEQYKNGEIESRKEYKDAKKINRENKREYKRIQKAESIDNANREIAKLASESDGLNVYNVRKDVKEALEAQLQRGEITKDEYKELKNHATKGSVFGRYFGKKSDSRLMFEAKRNRNIVENTKEEGPIYNVKTQAKLNMADLSTEELYNIIDENGAKYDGKVDRRAKKNDPENEQTAILKAMNEAAEEKGLGSNFFKKKDLRKASKDMGYKYESRINVGQVVKDASKGAILGAPFSYFNFSQEQRTLANAGMIGVDATSKQSTEIVGVGPAVGALAGAVAGLFRKEDKHEVPREELGKLLTEVEKTQPKVTVLDPGITNKVVSIRSEGPNYITLREIPGMKTGNYKVEKAGENWYQLAIARYGAEDGPEAKAVARQLKQIIFDSLKAEGNLPAGVEKSTDSFFVKVGDTVQVPMEIQVGNKTYKYDETKQVGTDKITNDYKGSFKNGVVSGPKYIVRDTLTGESKTFDSYDAAQTYIDNLKKGNPGRYELIGNTQQAAN